MYVLHGRVRGQEGILASSGPPVPLVPAGRVGQVGLLATRASPDLLGHPFTSVLPRKLPRCGVRAGATRSIVRRVGTVSFEM